MCVFVGLYVCACAYICVYVHVRLCACVCLYARMCACMYVSLCVCTYTHVCVCIHFLEVQKRIPLGAAQLFQFSVLSFILKASSET